MERRGKLVKDSHASKLPASTLTSWEVKPSERSRHVRYAIRDILEVSEQAKAAGKKLIYLNIGDPPLFDFPTPAHVIEAAYRAMKAGHTGYAPSLGTEDSIEAIRAEAGRQGIQNIQEVFVTSGVSEGIEIAFAALLNPGENMLIPCPGYPLYEATLAKLGFEANPYYLDESNEWQPDLDDMARRINNKTRGIAVLHPNNPTGSVIRREILAGIVELAARHGLMVFSDEIYNKLLLDPVECVSIASLAPELPVVTVNGISKAYLAPGFRIGWGILSGERRSVAGYGEAIAKMLRVRLSANHPAQYAIRPALEGSQVHVTQMVEKLRRRRDLTVSLLNQIPGIRCVSPQAAFYAFPRLEIAESDTEFVIRLIRETGVVVVPGEGFGQAPETKHFRIVFLPPEELLKEALDRIAEFAGHS
ncbi:MAG: aminotransferase class I/II-fold pyridoxal phosphate-dependent enzyme [Acidobacteria bacterium]|nr:aminotransferase class I/II-fold pyridoxal phosphate-dependent enzyme [Acidobacteriota bacterium]